MKAPEDRGLNGLDGGKWGEMGKNGGKWGEMEEKRGEMEGKVSGHDSHVVGRPCSLVLHPPFTNRICTLFLAPMPWSRLMTITV